jgi:hypothetical protein
MTPGLARAALRWAVLIVVVSAGLLLFLKPGTPEFVITVFTLGIGLVFGGLVIVLVRVMGR